MIYIEKLPALTAAAAFLAAAPLAAQDGQPAGGPPQGAQGGAVPTGGPPPGARQEGWTATVSAAPFYTPAWQGSDEMALSIFPDVRINYDDKLFASVPEGIGWNAINADGWKAGPVARVRFGRDEDNGGSPFQVAGGSDALIGMGDIDASIEAGGFIEKRFGSKRQWEIGARVVRGFGGYEGTVADFSLNRRLRSGGTIASFGPRISLASAGFMRPYFGIDAVQSANTGLTQYDPGGGILSYGVGGTVVRPLGRRSAITVISSIERLGSEPASSPLVRERGQRMQYSIGVAYGFRFGL